MFYPERTITLTTSDPQYVTPGVKALLRRKNRLMRSGRTEEAGALAIRVQAAIIRSNTAILRHTNAKSDSKHMWTKVRDLTKRNRRDTIIPSGVTAQTLNDHYAMVSTDSLYAPTKSKLTCLEQQSHITEWQVFKILDHLHHTATGLDQIPAWFLRLGAPVFSAPIAHLFNQSLHSSTVPRQWKEACISPIPKIHNPTNVTDYRPISITSVLSRILERHVVKTFIYPAILNPPKELYFQDQFAFRPTGSTTAALITMIHTINEMLQKYPYVHIFALDFSKAFDTVRHSTLLEKHAALKLQNEIYNWIKSFFDNHSHCTKFAGSTSALVNIMASVIQGSAIGPASYVVNTSDLRTITAGNEMIKFADDTYLIVPSINSHSCAIELEHVASWASANNLRLNQSKSMEMIIRARGARRQQVTLPPPLPGIERVESMTVLGVVVNNRMAADDHVNKTLENCIKTLYALRVLRTHGMPMVSLQEVFRATTLAKLLYGSPAWSGYCKASDITRLDAFLRRCKRAGYCAAATPSISELFNIADDALFKRVISNNGHVLHRLLPERTNMPYNIRPRRHNFELITKTTYLNQSNYLTRMLYKDLY